MPKSIFKSRTAALALFTVLMGACGLLSDNARQILSDHAAGILALLGLLNLWLRRITHGAVQFFPDEPPTDSMGNRI
jgi:hypothetical protein